MGILIFLAIMLTLVVGGVAACVANGVVTYQIARRTGRAKGVWTVLAVLPGINVVSSVYFYATTVLHTLDDINVLKAASAFDRPPVLGPEA